jgi:glycosyltransferase involved in cell wall biosynthesis
MKILLLTDVPPCNDFPGTLLTEELCRMLPEGSIAAFIVLNPYLNYVKISPDLGETPVEYVDKPRENALFPGKGKWKIIANFTHEMYNAKIRTARICDRAVAFGKANSIDRVWCILQGQTMIRLALPVARKLGVPLHSQLWDHPAWWLKDNGIDFISRKLILHEFAKAIRGSVCCAAASHAMAEIFQEIYSVDSVPILANLSVDMAYPPVRALNDKDVLSIGIAGQLYSHMEWQTLLTVLGDIGWKINHRKSVLRYLGNHFNIDLSREEYKMVNIEFLGYRPQNEAIRLLSECDILYCPYPFSNDLEIIAKTSFPSKLITYLATGKPVFFHGPDYAAPARFLKEHNAALMCHTLDRREVGQMLQILVSDENLYQELSRKGSRAFHDFLTTDVLRANFAKFLGIPLENLISTNK